MIHHEPLVKHHETLKTLWNITKHLNTRHSMWRYRRSMRRRRRSMRRCRRSARWCRRSREVNGDFGDCGVGRCVTELLIMEIWVLFPNSPGNRVRNIGALLFVFKPSMAVFAHSYWCRLIDSLSIILQKDLCNTSLINMYIWYTYESYIYFDLMKWQFNHVLLNAFYYINCM